MTSPLRVVATDRELQPRDFQIYYLLTEDLDSTQFRAIKYEWLARVVNTSKYTVHRSLRRLMRYGYIERDIPIPGTFCQYRLIHPYRWASLPLPRGPASTSANL